MVPSLNSVLALNAVSTWYMVGVIWFVQVVHYPLFSKVGTSGFSDYSQVHASLTTWVVGPAMVAELALALVTVFHLPTDPVSLLSLALVVLIWISTATLSVPQHASLSSGWNEAAWRKLVKTNWIRTIAWSLKGALALWLLVRVEF